MRAGRLFLWFLLIGLVVLVWIPSSPSAPETGMPTGIHAPVDTYHHDPPLTEDEVTHEAETEIIPFMLELALILLLAKFGSELLERIHQPTVLGELLVGVILGNLALLGFHSLDVLRTSISLAIAAQVGVILLLFQVGLESKLNELMSVGLTSILVAFTGVAAPMILGYAVGAFFLPDQPALVHVFLGAALCATSVGITARVLKDLGRTRSKEARVILGAAVIDDILGLMVLAVISGTITHAAAGGGASVSVVSILLILAKALLFLAGALVLGQLATRPFVSFLSHLKVPGVMLACSLSICFVFAAFAGILGLAPIVGAFIAGLILEPSHFRRFTARGERTVEETIQPLCDLFVPVFFVVMGLHVDLRNFADINVLGIAFALTAAAIIGKLLCGLVVVQKNVNRMIVSVGMIPRGEVGLIFASIGASLMLMGNPVIDNSTYSAVVVMVVVTTLVTPVWLKALYAKPDKKAQQVSSVE